MSSEPEDGEPDQPSLSADTLSALQAFYSEKDARRKQFEDLKAQAEDEFDVKEWSIDAFTEDWNASQFWYSDDTANALARELLDGATRDSCIAVVSAPSVFVKLKNLIQSMGDSQRPELRLLEFDERFAVFKEFVTYDFAQPMRLPEELKGRFDRIICDPPFLSADCQTKAALTVRWLARSWSPVDQRMIICTGERMESLILRLYEKTGVRTTDFAPRHTKGLSNEFRCFANFTTDAWQWSI